MNELHDIKGIIFDYGGTLDTNGKHWAEVLWDKYKETSIPVIKEQFKEAYVHGERMLALKPLIKPDHNFYDVLYIKVGLQLSYLRENGWLCIDDRQSDTFTKQIASECYEFVKTNMISVKTILEKLHKQYFLILVSNFYGNIRRILEDFGLLCFFKEIIESSVVGVRKPDPAIFRLGVDALGYNPCNVVVVGDSFSKDILPAEKIGCKTIWLKGEGWEEETDETIPDVVISDLVQVVELLLRVC